LNSPVDSAVEAPIEYRREKVRVGKVPVSTKLFQGIGALPGSHKDLAFNTFLLLYYSQILGVPATSASIVLAIALVVDAITDPLVGAYSDNFRSRFGRRHLFMYAAAIPLGLFMFLLFSPPAGASTAVLTGWLLTFTLLVRFAFTFFVIPWNALAAEYSQDYVERTSIITYRMLVGWTGGLAFFFLVFTFVFPGSEQYAKGQLDPRNYPLFAIVLGLLIPTWCLLTTHLTRREIPYLLQPVKPTPRLQFTALLGQILLAFHSPNFRRLFVAFMLFSGIAGINGVFEIYMNTYFWEFGTGELRWFGFVLIGALLAFAVIPPLQRRFEKQSILVLALATSLVFGMLKVALRFADVWPDNGDPLLLVLFVIHASVIVALLTVAGIMFSSMMADLVDEQEIRMKIRQEGVFISAIGFASKSVSSIGLIVGGLLLDLMIRFPRQSPPGEVDADTLFRLAFIDGIAVPALYVIPIYLLTRYSLTRVQLEDIQSELGRRA
jgi:glycoside/pentoside/hexuronide:cation symporter, GPH family